MVRSIDGEGSGLRGNDMDTTIARLSVLLPFFLLAEAVAATFAWRLSGRGLPRPAVVRADKPLYARLLGMAASGGLWLLLTAVSLWCAFLVAFVVVHGLLFSLGLVAAWAGLVAAGAVLVCIPFAWGWVILSEARRG